MNQERANFQDVFAKLAGENLLDSGWEEKTRVLIAREHNEQAWYVRVMVGFSAWLASWMLIGFVVGAAIVESEQASLILGLLLVAGAVIGRYVSDNDFITQMTLAVNLAGEALIVFAVAQISHSFETTTFSFIMLQLVLLVIYPDAVHRFLSASAVIGALSGLLYQWKAIAWVHVIVIGFAALFVYLVIVEQKFLARGQAQFIIPMKWGVLFGQLSVLMMSTVYILPEIAKNMEIFPLPWISSVGLGLLFLCLVYWLIRAEKFPLTQGNTAAVYSISVIAIAAATMAPGLIMALIILLLGFAVADRVLLGVAIGFFTVFLAAFFYGIEITLLLKSIVLIATGAVLLAGRTALKFYLTANKEMAIDG
ncbi:MAG: DUF4401 domain-containing protein [Gammaproteobacteria bacterium]|nr:DUF4401 domain-containing protein [Gammaproteobacteria bacterium]